MLDQGITTQRAYNINAGHIAFILIGQLGHRAHICIRKTNTAGLDELAWWNRTKARDNTIKRHFRFTFWRFQYQHGLLRCALRSWFDAHRSGLIKTLDHAFFDLVEYRRIIRFLGAGKLRLTIHYIYCVVTTQRERVFDTGVAATNHDDMLVFVFVRVIQSVLHQRCGFAGNTQSARVSLHTHSQHNMLGADAFTLLQGNFKSALAAIDRCDFGIAFEIDPMCIDPALPGVQHFFSFGRGELDWTAQRQHTWLVHHMLAFLIMKYGVTDMRLGFEQNMTDTEFRCTRRSAQTTGA